MSPPPSKNQLPRFAETLVYGGVGAAALGLAGAIFMILETDQPYRGVVKIPSTSLRIALDQLGRS